MKVVILAGGYGTRISEESVFKPKPMIEIGGMPILWHIMKLYSYYGYNDFIICAGYKQEYIKQWFANYYTHISDVTFDFTNGYNQILHYSKPDPWKVTVVDTGLNTNTAGRIKRIAQYLNNEDFMLTYGDGIGDINLNDLVKYHQEKDSFVTLTQYNYRQHKGILNVNSNGLVTDFREKSDIDSEPINIGYMVCKNDILKYINEDNCCLESDVLSVLSKENKLYAYQHNGYWQCMDTLREKQQIEKLWESNSAPWKIWG